MPPQPRTPFFSVRGANTPTCPFLAHACPEGSGLGQPPPGESEMGKAESRGSENLGPRVRVMQTPELETRGSCAESAAWGTVTAWRCTTFATECGHSYESSGPPPAPLVPFLPEIQPAVFSIKGPRPPVSDVSLRSSSSPPACPTQDHMCVPEGLLRAQGCECPGNPGNAWGESATH